MRQMMYRDLSCVIATMQLLPFWITCKRMKNMVVRICNEPCILTTKIRWILTHPHDVKAGKTVPVTESSSAKEYEELSFIARFLIPSLNAKTFKSLLRWDPEDERSFLIKWTHKAKSSWSVNECAVFLAWDCFKGRKQPADKQDYVNAKQRLRAALRKINYITEIACSTGYRKYKIKHRMNTTRGSNYRHQALVGTPANNVTNRINEDITERKTFMNRLIVLLMYPMCHHLRKA
ncbi:hypothetical protein CEXT_475411 [Caerostris extrusa]|uniref:IRF tryptophan pentad repeat domain-containing protein n=1 Tax=Caerostris extrusa TaxID=172846 RepID=A0AAV4XX47_CAEEX|nr:hypothetical protein CEXT_475411 [Caerostris extrusa]